MLVEFVPLRQTWHSEEALQLLNPVPLFAEFVNLASQFFTKPKLANPPAPVLFVAFSAIQL